MLNRSWLLFAAVGTAAIALYAASPANATETIKIGADFAEFAR